jgi:acetolactate synthase-1/2/3 large subunit
VPQRVVAEAIGRAVARHEAVLVEIPEDVADTTIPFRSHPTAASTARPVAAPDAVSPLVSEIEGARRPVILAGQGCADDRVSKQLLRRCLDSGLSVVTTQMGKGCVPESHARSLRSLGMHRPDYANAALAEADLVICIGYQPVEHPPLAWNAAPERRIIHVHSEPARRELGYEPELEVIGDIAAMLDRLEGIQVATGWSDTARASINACLDAELDELPRSSVARVPDIVAAVVSENHVVALDNGLYKIWFARRFPALHPHALVLDNALATMGAGLATGMAAARLGRPALVVTGDGGFLMNGVELETAKRLELDLTVLVLRDDRFGFIAWHQDEQDRRNEGVELSNPDLVGFAASFGARGRRVTTGDELARALRDPAPGITVIDYPVDYSCNAMLERDDLLEQAQPRIGGSR